VVRKSHRVEDRVIAEQVRIHLLGREATLGIG
jgi:hypothetical protein